jgi:ribosomal protein S18 acetylase RimI-like enzyme
MDTNDIVVKLAQPEDSEGVFNVQRKAWLDTYPNHEIGITEEDIRVRIEGKNGELIPNKIERWRHATGAGVKKLAVFVVKDAGRVVGFVAPAIRDGQRRVGAIYVLPEMQNKGIGGKLLESAIGWHGRSEAIYLHVASYNKKAIDFYKRNGFEETGKEIADEVAKVGDGKAIPEIEMVLRAISD